MLLLLSSMPVNGRAQEIVGKETRNGSASGGAVIEIGGGGEKNDAGGKTTGAADQNSLPVNITRNPGETGIEMIVGGEGKDGVAKRSNLPVVE